MSSQTSIVPIYIYFLKCNLTVTVFTIYDVILISDTTLIPTLNKNTKVNTVNYKYATNVILHSSVNMDLRPILHKPTYVSSINFKTLFTRLQRGYTVTVSEKV